MTLVAAIPTLFSCLQYYLSVDKADNHIASICRSTLYLYRLLVSTTIIVITERHKTAAQDHSAIQPLQ